MPSGLSRSSKGSTVVDRHSPSRAVGIARLASSAATPLADKISRHTVPGCESAFAVRPAPQHLDPVFDRPARQGRSARFNTMPSSPVLHAARNRSGRSRPARMGRMTALARGRQNEEIVGVSCQCTRAMGTGWTQGRTVAGCVEESAVLAYAESKAKKGVICLTSALAFHRLTDTIPRVFGWP